MADEAKSVLVMIAILVLVVIIVRLVVKLAYSPESDGGIQFSSGPRYRQKVYKTVPSNLRTDFDRLNDLLSELKRQIAHYDAVLSAQKEEAAAAFVKKASQAENIIAACWNRQQRMHDFYYCIALHYASFMLANQIKAEQLKIRDSFVAVKKKTDSYTSEIEKLNKAIPLAKGARRQEMMQRHSELCKQHKRLCGLKSRIGGMNTKYHEILDDQNRKTGVRRDYIIAHFGDRGKRWGAKLAKNKQDAA